MSDWLKIGAAVSAGVVATGYLAHKFYFAGGTCKYRADLTGKVAIVTGSNTGIGKETSKLLAEMGAHVILACRNVKLGAEAVEDIKKAIGNKGKLEVMELDLSSLQSVRQFAEEFKKKNLALNLLINNAGIMALPKRETTKDGFEAQFGVNHLGHFLLTNLLIEPLKAGKPSRVVNLSSIAHRRSGINFDDLMSEKSYSPWKVYGQSKTANILFTVEFQRRFAEHGVQAYAVHPGGVRSDLSRNLGFAWAQFLLQPVLWVIFKSVWEGSQTSLYCAISPDAGAGKYHKDCAVFPAEPWALDAGAAKKLWEVSEELVGLNKK